MFEPDFTSEDHKHFSLLVKQWVNDEIEYSDLKTWWLHKHGIYSFKEILSMIWKLIRGEG
jgi:hypothetical protein